MAPWDLGGVDGYIAECARRQLDSKCKMSHPTPSDQMGAPSDQMGAPSEKLGPPLSRWAPL